MGYVYWVLLDISYGWFLPLGIMVWGCWSQVPGTKLLWNGWILSEAVGGSNRNNGKNDKSSSIWVKELAAACQGISMTSIPKYLGLWLGLITIKN
jgi:hypothetical protein